MIWPFTERHRPAEATFKHLRPGCRYHVVKPFFDHDNIGHPLGESWIFRHHDFLPHEDGVTLHVEMKNGTERMIRLQWRPETEGPVLDTLEDYLSTEPGERKPLVSLRFTRDSVCMADDMNAPHESLLEVEADADGEAIAHAIMVQNRLAHVGSTGIWSIALGGDQILFGVKEGRRFVRPNRVGGHLRARDIDAVHAHYHAQQDPTDAQ